MNDLRFPNIDLDAVRKELRRLLDVMTLEEILELRRRISSGRIDGWVYAEDREGDLCGCLYGTFAILRGATDSADVLRMIFEMKLRREFEFSPLEAFVASVMLGDTPESSPYARWLIEQIDAYPCVQQVLTFAATLAEDA